jgi:signal transduction histidine kinase
MEFVSAVFAPLVAPVTYARWLHLFIAAGFAAACVAVVPGLEGSPAATALALFLVPVPLLVLAGLLPGVREAERLQARLMLFVGSGAELGTGSDRSWSARLRTVAWLVLRLELAVVVAYLTVYMIEAAAMLSVAPFRTGELVILGWSVPASRSPLWPATVPVLIGGTIHVVAIAGRLLAAGARWLLGPSPAERLAAYERRTEQLLEHNRVAREIHDSIGHALAIMVLQATAAREVRHRDEQFHQQALVAIEETGRRAMLDLERVLAVLRDDQSSAERPPTLVDTDRLLAAARATGAQVRAHIEGPVESLPAVVSREGYRILQEGLTNAFRHVGPVPVTVRVVAGADLLELCVDNPLSTGDGGEGRGPAVPAPDAAARARPCADCPAGTGSALMRDASGLRGIRERVTVLGGDLTAGRVGSDWRLRVRLPLAPAASP